MTPGPVRVTGELLSNRRIGAFQHLSLVAAGVVERFRPGSLLSVAVGGPLSAHLVRRSFPILRARPSAYGGTVELLVEASEPGEDWLVRAPVGAKLDLLGPVGRPFALPKEPVPCLLIGYGVHAVPLLALAERLRERRCEVHLLLGAPGGDRLVGVLESRRAASSVTVVTADGSVGVRGTVTGLLEESMRRTSPQVVYAAGDRDLLAAAALRAEDAGVWSQTMTPVASTSMPCGTGICGTCTVEVVAPDGVRRRVRACTEGPVFRGDRVCWNAQDPRVAERTA